METILTANTDVHLNPSPSGDTTPYKVTPVWGYNSVQDDGSGFTQSSLSKAHDPVGGGRGEADP